MNTRFMEVDGKISEIVGDGGGIRVVQRNQGENQGNNKLANQTYNIVGGENFENERIIMDPKRKRVNSEDNMEGFEKKISTGLISQDGPKT